MRAAVAMTLVVLSLGAGTALAEAPSPTPGGRIGVRVLPQGKGVDAEAARRLVENLRGPRVQFVPVDLLDLALMVPEDAVRLEERARSLELELSFREAAGVWRELVERLISARALLLDPQRVARAQIALAAANAEAGEQDLAVIRFRDALALDADFAPGPEYAPRVRELFERALQLGPALPPTPGDGLLDEIIRAGKVDGVLWVAVGRESGRRILVRRLRLLGQTTPSTEVRTQLPDAPKASHKALVADAAVLRRELALAFPGGPLEPTPWWRQGWFVWTAASSAAVLLTTLVLARILGPKRVDFVVQH